MSHLTAHKRHSGTSWSLCCLLLLMLEDVHCGTGDRSSGTLYIVWGRLERSLWSAMAQRTQERSRGDELQRLFDSAEFKDDAPRSRPAVGRIFPLSSNPIAPSLPSIVPPSTSDISSLPIAQFNPFTTVNTMEAMSKVLRYSCAISATVVCQAAPVVRAMQQRALSLRTLKPCDPEVGTALSRASGCGGECVWQST